jgi:hypothetical protein
VLTRFRRTAIIHNRPVFTCVNAKCKYLKQNTLTNVYGGIRAAPPARRGGARKHSPGPKPNPRYFFWSGNGDPKSAVADWQRSYRRLFKSADIRTADGERKRCHPHMFRDTFAVEMLLAGVPIDQVSLLLGHAIVIAQELVRIEVLRIGRTYELAITRLWLKTEDGHTRPAIDTAPLFRGHQGTLAVELWNAKNKSLRGTVAPLFYTAAGEVLDLPDRFEEAIRKITGAVACPGCKHTHVAVAPATNVT